MDNNGQELNDLINSLRLENKALGRKVAHLEAVIERNKVTQAAKVNVSKILTADKSRLEKYMKLILDKYPEITLLFDNENRLAYCTEAFVKISKLVNFGLIENKTFREIFSARIDGEKLNIIERNFNESLSNKLPVSFEIDLDIEKGVMRNYRVLFTPMLGDSKETEGAMAMFHDMTDIIDAKEKALTASRAKTNFLANMSHEMRTPLNVIMGMTSIAMSDDEKTRKDYCLGKISVASAHLLSVINDILDMSKIESDRYELNENNFILENAIQKTVDVLRFRFEEKRHSFTIDLSKDLPRLVFADEQRLMQVLTNILSNAIKFTDPGGCISLIARKAYEENDYTLIEFKVSDSGIGISQEQQKSLFRSFEQADGEISRRYGGTGLGLAISKSIIEKMGGEIRLESAIGTGSAFIFSVRVKTLRDETGTQELQDPSTLKGKRVLVAEDIDINREIVEALLSDLGVIVDFADNGIATIGKFVENCKQINEKRYGMIFMDIHMPEMDGYEATRAIRALDEPRAKVIPIVAMTANVFREDVKRCIAAGMNGHIGKPLDFNEVISTLIKFL